MRNSSSTYQWILTLLLTWSGLIAHGQDPQLTQFYSMPMYLNPAFAGNTIQSRVAMNYRVQWPAIPGAFHTQSFAYDHQLYGIKSGLGIMLQRDKAGTGGLRYTSATGVYSYGLSVTRKIMFRMGMSLGLVQRNIDFNKLTFTDQLLRDDAQNSVDQVGRQKTSYPDVAAGMALYSSTFWFGTSVLHINRPNQSLAAGESIVPLKFSVHGGVMIPVVKDIRRKVTQSVNIVGNYRFQAEYDQFDLGVYYNYEPMVAGVWYRGIPGFKAYDIGYQNNDAFAFLVGYAYRDVKLAYSYDITISRLILNTGGAHEISLTYEFASPENKRKNRRRNFVVPCAKF